MSQPLSQRWYNFIYPDTRQLPIDKRVFVGIPAFAFVLVTLFAIMEFTVGRSILGLLDLVAMAALALVYYLGRFRQRYILAASVFAITSYILIIASFFLNAGSHGPMLYIFLISFVMIIGLTPSRHHPWWLSTHLLTGILLMTAEWLQPQWIRGSYSLNSFRLLDIYLTFSASIVFLYLAQRYLRKSYNTERQLAHQRGEEVAKHSQQIEEKNKELEQVNAEKHRLLSVVAHDLRGPLGNMRSFVQMINTEEVSESERKQLHRDLLKLTNNAYMLLDNLLHWSQPAVKNNSPALQAIDLSLAIHESLELLQPAADAKELTLGASESEPFMVLAQREMLNLIIRNLVSNAIKFTDRGGRITVFTSRSEAGVSLKVYDTGVGISAEQQATLFREAHNSSYGTNQESGVGLGLVLCREYAEAMGGRIRVESKVGAGSTFTVELKTAD